MDGTPETTSGQTPQKSNTAWWIAGGCLVLMTIGMLLAGCLGAYLWYRARQPEPVQQPSTGVPSTPTTSVTPIKGYSTPEEAVRARVGSTMVLDVRNRTADTAEVWVGPPNSEFLGIYDVKKGADGSWAVTGQRDVPAVGEGDEGGGSSQTGSSAPWVTGGTGFLAGSPPSPNYTRYPSSGPAHTAWISVGEMFGALKADNPARARGFCTSGFYSSYGGYFFDKDFLSYFKDFEVLGYDSGTSFSPAIWVRLKFRGDWVQYVVITTTVSGARGLAKNASIYEPQQRAD